MPKGDPKIPTHLRLDRARRAQAETVAEAIGKNLTGAVEEGLDLFIRKHRRATAKAPPAEPEKKEDGTR